MIEALKHNKELWELFTRKEEYNPLILDQHQRFPYYLSKHRNILEPEVSKFLIEKGLNLEVEYPEGKKVLGKKAIGYRNHFLKFKVPDTWTLLEKAGFKYDTTFGYAMQIW